MYSEQSSPNVLTIKGAAYFMWSVDFLRLTRPKSDTQAQFFTPTRQAVLDAMQEGHLKKPYRIGDMQGVLCGNVAYMQSKTHWGCEFRGSLAEAYYLDYININSHCTRLDLALTIWLNEYDRGLAVKMHNLATDYHHSMGWGDRRKWPILIHGMDGDTCYLGSRSSDRYIRLYDKWKRSTDDFYLNAWRFEIELKANHAAILWQDIQTQGDAKQVAASEMTNALAQRGILLEEFPIVGSMRKVPYIDTPKDITSRLNWLQRQVRPALVELERRGYREAALAVLGIYDESTVTNVTDE